MEMPPFSKDSGNTVVSKACKIGFQLFLSLWVLTKFSSFRCWPNNLSRTFQDPRCFLVLPQQKELVPKPSQTDTALTQRLVCHCFACLSVQLVVVCCQMYIADWLLINISFERSVAQIRYICWEKKILPRSHCQIRQRDQHTINDKILHNTQFRPTHKLTGWPVSENNRNVKWNNPFDS